MRRSVCRNRAFTLLEIMVVICIIAILASVMFRGYRNRDRSAKLQQCRANLTAIADAMEAFKSNDGEYVHSGTYKFSTSVAGGSKDTDTVSLSLGDTDGNLDSEGDVDIAKLIEVSDKSLFKCFANLPVQCPADDTKRTKAATSYHVIVNARNFTVYCTCGEKHSLESGFPRYVHGTMNGDHSVTLHAGLENADGVTE